MNVWNITGNTELTAHLRERLGLPGYMTWFDGQVKRIVAFSMRSAGGHVAQPDLASLEMTMLIIQAAIARYTIG